ncbi:MAG TPA: nucleotidyltransferase domain-containing protein [Tepidisphaeraceae bacterium]
MVSPMDPADVLFGGTRQAILALLFTRPDESFYLREIARRTGRGVGPVQRELAQLTACGILRRQKERFFGANPDSPIFEPLRQIVVRTVGLAGGLRDAMRPLAEQIAVAFMFGSFARGGHGESSDVDILVVTRDDRTTLKDVTVVLWCEQDRLGREVNPFVISAREFRAKWRAKNHFIHRVVEGEKIFLIGDEHDLDRLAEERLVKAAPDQPTGNRRPARAGGPRPQGRQGQRTQR